MIVYFYDVSTGELREVQPTVWNQRVHSELYLYKLEEKDNGGIIDYNKTNVSQYI